MLYGVCFDIRKRGCHIGLEREKSDWQSSSQGWTRNTIASGEVNGEGRLSTRKEICVRTFDVAICCCTSQLLLQLFKLLIQLPMLLFDVSGCGFKSSKFETETAEATDHAELIVGSST